MTDRPVVSAIGIRAIVRGGDPDDPAADSGVELFDTVQAAIAVAADRLRAADGRRWRIAIDAGEVHLGGAEADGATLSVVADRRSAAVLGAASAGQLLVTGPAASLVAELPDGLALDDLGRHRFHGVDSRLAVFECRGEGVASTPIRTIDMVASSIPVPPSPLIGRVDLLAELVDAMRTERVVTLTGSGGTGKTRLAVDVAFASAGRFDAVHWADLAPLGSEAALVDEVAAVVGARHNTGAGRRAALLEALRDGQCLLVLDNAEHLVEATAALVVEATERCPTLHVLVTTREALGISAESVRRIPPLTVAADDTPDVVAGSEATIFLVDRLRRAGVDASLDGAALVHLRRICTRLDGIPLALELAAARAAIIPLADLADTLDDRFDLLSATRRDAHPRQRTIEASIRWSCELLSEGERVTLRRLAVFSGPFEPADAIEVDGGEPGPVADRLRRLVERSLVAPLDDGRLRLLETVRAFAEDRLGESGETRSVRDRHLAWVRTRCAEIAPLFDGPDPAVAAASARLVMNDARAAMAHAEQTGRSEDMWGLLTDLVYSFFYEGQLDEAHDWATRADAVDDGRNPAAASAGLVAAALLATLAGATTTRSSPPSHGHDTLPSMRAITARPAGRCCSERHTTRGTGRRRPPSHSTRARHCAPLPVTSPGRPGAGAARRWR